MSHVFRIIIVLIGMASLVAGCGQGQQNLSLKNVFGTENRRELTTDQYPWRAIGLLSVGCTGTLVSKDLVVTAAHCVIDATTRRPKANLGVFYPNYRNGHHQDQSTMTWVWWGTNDPPDFRGADWAIVRLKEPLGSKYGWLGIQPTDVHTFPNRLSVAGYSDDFHGGKTAGVHHNCLTRGRDVSKGWIYHDCDTARGASGGPVLRNYHSKLTIYGINVAELRDGRPHSLHLPQYESQHANVAIPTAGFLHKVKALEDSNP